MRVAVLADIHANLPALEVVLAEPDVAGADRVVLLGDIALGPMPAESLDLLASLGERARNASEEERSGSPGRDWTSADRQTTYPQDWSHERFMRFVESTPP